MQSYLQNVPGHAYSRACCIPLQIFQQPSKIENYDIRSQLLEVTVNIKGADRLLIYVGRSLTLHIIHFMIRLIEYE